MKSEVVVNPLSWARMQVVELPTDSGNSPPNKKFKREIITQLNSDYKLLGKIQSIISMRANSLYDDAVLSISTGLPLVRKFLSGRGKVGEF